MTGNPELRRNLWLEFTTTRLIGMPLVMGAIFFLAWLSDDHQFGSGVRGTAIALFVALSILWGSRQATESIFGELRERTWDWQRLSAIGPWSLTWGKLAGSTLYTWYGGVMALFFFLLADSALRGTETIITILTLLMTALLAQAMSMLASLLTVIRERSITGSHSTAVLIMALFVIYPLGMVGIASGTTNWYGGTYATSSFALCSLAAFTFWALTGVYRNIRLEFRMRSLPTAWIGFLVFMMVYCAGFVEKAHEFGFVSSFAVVAMTVSAGAVYLAILLERKDPVGLRQLFELFQQRAWRPFLESAPCWLLALPCVLSAAAVLLLLPGNLTKELTPASTRGVVMACVGFLLRDVGLLLYLNLARQAKRADLFAVLCLGILYGLLPVILIALDLDSAIALFWPRHTHWGISLAAAPLEAAAIWWLLAGRWKRQTV